MKGIMGLLSPKKNKKSLFDPGILTRDAKYLVLDTELTGLDEKHDSIVSIGAVRMVGSRIELSDAFYSLVKPDTQFTPKSVVIHGITPSEVLEESRIDMVLSEFLKFCGSDIVIGYCISIDLCFLNKAMKRILGFTLPNPVVDIFSVYEWTRKRTSLRGKDSLKLPVLKESGLYEMAKFFEIPINGAHNAMGDAYITAQIFKRLMNIIFNEGIRSINDLLRIGDPYKGGGQFIADSEIKDF